VWNVLSLTVALLVVTAEKQLEPRVVVEQLGHRDFRVRVKALESLRQMGPLALPALRQARDHKDPGVRKAVRELTAELEHAALLAPKRVTIRMHNAKVADVIEALRKQSGYRIDCWGADDSRRLNLNMDRVPFWVAVEQIGRGGGVWIMPMHGDRRIILQRADHVTPYFSQQGAFCLAAVRFEEHSRLDLARTGKPTNPPALSRNLTLFLALMAEPRLPIVRVGPPELLAVLDDRKNSMIPGPSTDRNEGRPYRYYHSGHAATCCDVPVDLVRGKDSRSIAEIRGQVPVTLLLEEKEVVLTDKILQARGKVFESGDLRLTVLSVEKKNPACWTLKLTISSKAAGDDSWSNSLYNRLSLVDSKGQKMGSMGGGWGGNGGVINAEFNYQVTGNDPARLVFTSWTTVAHQVRFEFRNLPLP